ncbi:hypothetical protein [Bacillus sp. FJAT-49711]|uniref:hypothetical protein n=1 Tax=Bacillus sp. FJAT-49711 TaxID=2833585 RepID=UPI0020167E83|nr:hypothetical protein [Bacillus sp. FJAT-49711]
MSNRLAVITYHESDFLNAIKTMVPEAAIILPHDFTDENLESFDSIALLGGGDEEPLLLEPRQRVALENQIHKGKRVFAEYVASIGNVYFSKPESTRYDRLVYCSSTSDIPDLKIGSLLDDQCGQRIMPHDITCTHDIPILQYVRRHAHDHINLDETLFSNISDRALWFDHPKNLLICAFRICNFRKSRYSPWNEIKKLVEFIIGWLLDRKVLLSDLSPIYSSGTAASIGELSEDQIKRSVLKSMEWFESAGILLSKGKRGAWEGYGTEIYPNGNQRKVKTLRADCIGEISLPYFLDYLLCGNKESIEVSNNLQDFIFDHYLNREEGFLYGMMRWTNEAWGVCYQDDVARAIMPQLLKCLYLNIEDHLDDCIDVLKFLVKTTGSDGTRVFRTDNIDLSEEKMKELAERPGNLPSAHYNGYYYAALLLTYQLTNIEEFKKIAIKGLTTIMQVYPDTIREQSETQEYCRLILPLSYLYWVTKDPIHKDWLYRVTHDLKQFKHSSGAYLEWDSDYKASMRNGVGEGESSLVSKNGDPVVDLLYSNNWLPMAFIQAYWITGDTLFKELWKDISRFLVSAQLNSEVSTINGAWARAYDVNKKEVIGSPADMGWGPWAIESGWTVAEISAGLSMGLLEKQLAKFYKVCFDD